MERLSEREKDEIARLAAAGLRSRLIGHQNRAAPSYGLGSYRSVASSGGAGAGAVCVAVVVGRA